MPIHFTGDVWIEMRNYINYINYIIITCLALAPSLSGCRMEGLEPPVLADETMAWDIRLNHQAALLSLKAPYDTLQLSVLVRNAQGVVILRDAPATFRTSSQDIAVDSNGMIRAVKAASEAWVIAEVMLGLTRVKDSVRIRIQAAAPTVTPEQITIPVDSQKIAARVAQGFNIPKNLSFAAVVTGTNGQRMTNPYIRYWVSDSSIAAVDAYTGSFYGRAPGRVWVYAGSTIYGVSLLDSVEIRITHPLIASVGGTTSYVGASAEPQVSFAPQESRIGVGGTVAFVLYIVQSDTIPYDVQFDAPERAGAADLAGLPGWAEFLYSPGGGNIDPTVPSPTGGHARTFWYPGRYRYWSDRLKAEGVIVVVE